VKHSLYPRAVFRFFAAGFLCMAALAASAEPPSPGIVHFATQARPGDGNDYAGIRQMVDALVCAVTGDATPRAAWGRLINPSDRIGIKVDAEGAPGFATRPAVVDAIVSRLVEVGVPRNRIIIWDRDETKVRAAGYKVDSTGPLLRGGAAAGYDPREPFSAPVLGRLIWGDLQFRSTLTSIPGVDPPEQVSNLSHLTRVLGEVDKVINVPLLKASETCGIAGALFNMSVANVDNWRRLAAEPGADPGIVELYMDKRIGQKVVLTIMDGITAQCGGGPGNSPDHAVDHGRLYASRDPVALDAHALNLIEEWRKASKLPGVTRFAGYLETGEVYRLGNATDIELRRVSAAGAPQ
jgi:uncharacterized protein (DUF362 family)